MAELWRPALADVAALLHARTKSSTGSELGTFDTTTRPTGDQVEKLIDIAVSEIRPRMDLEPEPDYAGAAKTVATLRAAMLVELSFYPEETLSGEGQLAYQTLRLHYESALGRLAPRRRLV